MQPQEIRVASGKPGARPSANQAGPFQPRAASPPSGCVENRKGARAAAPDANRCSPGPMWGRGESGGGGREGKGHGQQNGISAEPLLLPRPFNGEGLAQGPPPCPSLNSHPSASSSPASPQAPFEGKFQTGRHFTHEYFKLHLSPFRTFFKITSISLSPLMTLTAPNVI